MTQWEVEQVIFDAESEPRWDVDPRHGGRVVIRGHTRGDRPRLLFIALRPLVVETGTWACITAFPIDEDYGMGDEEGT